MPTRRSIALFLTVALAACGGGSGTPPPVDPGDGGGGGGGSGFIEIDATVADDARGILGSSELGLEPELLLRSALARAGFDQVNELGAVQWGGEAPRQGVVFEWMDAELIAAGLASGGRVPLDDLLAGWGALSPALTADVLRPKLVADLRAAATGADPTRRYWAQLIAQLGRTSDVPYDLLDPAVPGTAALDPVQVALLVYRFQAEVWREAGKAAGPGLVARLRAAEPRPCTMTDTESTVMDAAALAGSTFFGELIGEIGKAVPGVEKVAKYGGLANAALTVVKFLWTLAALDARITADSTGIVRNWDGTANGDEATLTATFRYDTGNAQAFNCVRPALNVLGLDFSLPQDGPVANARVDWEMFAVKDRRGPGPIVRYKEGSAPIGRHTDPEGKDAVTLEGTRKEPALTGRIGPDHRLVPVVAKVALKDTRMWQDIQDAVGTALAGNPASMALSVLTETLLRMNSLVFAARHGLPVEDHRSLDGVVMRVELAGALSGAIRSSGAGHETLDATVSLVERPASTTPDPLHFAILNGSPGMAFAYLSENGKRDVRYRGALDVQDPCACVEGFQHRVDDAAWASVWVDDDTPRPLVATMQPDGRFELRLGMHGKPGIGRHRQTLDGCGAASTHEDPMGGPVEIGDLVVTGQVDPTKTSGTIEGTWSGTVDIPRPASLGGFWVNGVSHDVLHAATTVEYVFEYTLQVVTVPTASSPSPAAAAWAPRSTPTTVRWVPREPAVRACYAPGPAEPPASRG